MLGMIIGVSAVITLVAMGNGAQSVIEDQIKGAGTNMITVNAGNASQGGVRGGSGTSSTLTVDDADAIRKEIPGVQYLVARRPDADAGGRGQPELVHAHSGHGRRSAADSRVADARRQFLQRAGCHQRRQGRGPRKDGQRDAVRRRRRSGRSGDPHPQSAVQGDRRDGGQGPDPAWARTWTIRSSRRTRPS